MNESSKDYSIGQAEQRVFDVEDTRERADRLKDELTPKLEILLDLAYAEILVS